AVLSPFLSLSSTMNPIGFNIVNRPIKNCSNKCEKVTGERTGLLNGDDRNGKNIVCRRCGSLFFAADTVIYVEDVQRELKLMSHQGAGKVDKEKISWWWFTDDDLDFDTIGFQTVDGVKVLMCGDCEFGPIGLREANGKFFFLAVERCSYN
ncbi:hypothetical protein PMAYCL1PPCAC_06601, partial [Pristionchus mayeri]